MKSYLLGKILVIAICLVALISGFWISVPIDAAQIATGTLRIVHGDGPLPRNENQIRVFLKDDSGNSQELKIDHLSITKDELAKLDGKSVKANLDGDYLLNVTALTQESPTQLNSANASPGILAPQSFSATRIKKVVTLLCAFSGNSAQPHAIPWFQGMMGSTYPGLDHYWREVSYNQLGIDGSAVNDWTTLPKTRAQYLNPQTLSFDLDTVRKDCITASNAQVDFSTVDIINMVFNDNLDGYSWGSRECSLNSAIGLDGNNNCLGFTWIPDTAGFQNQAIFAHEMGHGLGLPHSSGPYGSTYDSQWDLMSGGYGAFNPTYGYVGSGLIGFNKLLLDWIPQDREGIADLQSAQTFDLERLNNPVSTTNPLVVTLFSPAYNGQAGRLFTIESRFKIGSNVGYDSTVPGDAVIIHNVDFFTDNEAQVADSNADLNSNVNDASAMWTVGETYIDPTYNLAVKINSKSATSFNITVSSAAPVVRITSPTDGQYIAKNSPISLSATATSAISTVSKVEYYNGSAKIGESTVAPYNLNWTTSTIGAQTITAIGYDAAGRNARSSAITINVFDISFSGWYSDANTLTQKVPDIASFKNRLYQVIRGNNKLIYIRTSSDGYNWTWWRQLDGETDQAVTLGVANGRLFITHVGLNKRIYTRYTTDGNNWTFWQENGGETSKPVYMEGFNNNLFQTHRGENGKIYTRYTPDGFNWSGWQQTDGDTHEGVVLRAFNGRLYQVHRGDNQQIYTRSSPNGINWTGWASAGGTTDVPIGMGVKGNKLYQSRVGTDSSLYIRYSTDGETWLPWVLTPGNSLEPIMMTNFNGNLYQSHAGLNSYLYLRTVN